MDQFKSLLQSKTVWTNIVGVGASLLTAFGFDLTPEDQAAIITCITSVQGVLSIFRVAATKKLA